MKGFGKGKSAYEVAFADQYWQNEEHQHWQNEERGSAAREDLGGGGAGIDQVCRECPEHSPAPELDTWASVIRRRHKKGCGCGERAVEYVGRQEDAGINAVGESLGAWERIPIKIDSGAIDADL